MPSRRKHAVCGPGGSNSRSPAFGRYQWHGRWTECLHISGESGDSNREEHDRAFHKSLGAGAAWGPGRGVYAIARRVRLTADAG
jgi:hypothetical protein